jgi:hypothetical protein
MSNQSAAANIHPFMRTSSAPDPERSRPEYYQLIRRVVIAPAIADLNKNTGEARLLAYDRVHSALTAQLRVVSPSLSKVALAEFQRLALEDAIQKVEVECRTLAVLSRLGAPQARLSARFSPQLHGDDDFRT